MNDFYVFMDDLNFIRTWYCIYGLSIVFVIHYM
jgi:hypothetical protein